MTPSLALAGLAEGAMEIEIWLNCGVFAALGVLLAIGIKKKGKKATIGALAIFLIYQGLFQPWRYFEEMDPNVANPGEPEMIDYDIIYWNERFNKVGYIFNTLSGAVIPLILVSFLRLRQNELLNTEPVASRNPDKPVT